MDYSTRYAPPEDYYSKTKNRKPSAYLNQAVGLIHKTKKNALDFGCGAGSDSRFLVNSGFNVIAVDGNPQSLEYIEKLPHQDKITFICSPFEKFSFDQYDLVSSFRALSFIHKDIFNDVMNALLGSLNTDGIFVGEFYGVKDEWNKPHETMTFLDKEQIYSIFKNMSLIAVHEEEKDDHTANGKPKHWHRFYVIAQNL